VLASTYDAMNDRTQLTATVAGTADFLNAYTFDADQNLLQTTQESQTGGNGVAPKGVGYAYNLNGQITSVLDFDPTTSSPHPDIAYGTLSYDSGNRLTQIDYTHSGSTLDDLSWSYNAANLVTGFTSSVDGSASYSYDTTNQLTAATYTGTNQPANESNSFDANGNRTNTGYTTGTNNQLTSDGTFNYTYDHEGNRVSRTRISSGTANDYITDYSYDYRNRLTDVNYYNNSSVLTKHIHYVYDVYDHLIGTEIDATGSGSYSSSEWYALDISADPNAPAQPVLQFDGSGNETYRYLNGPSASGVDAVMAEEAITTQGSAGTTTYPLADNLGSVRDIVNTSSAVVDHIIYNSFGQVAYESNTAIHHRAGYADYHSDGNTGLDYADHRWYDPSVGRWISEDPLGFHAGDTNVSRYVANRATNSTDPSGLSVWAWFVGKVVEYNTGNETAGDVAEAAVNAAEAAKAEADAKLAEEEAAAAEAAAADADLAEADAELAEAEAKSAASKAALEAQQAGAAPGKPEAPPAAAEPPPETSDSSFIRELIIKYWMGGLGDD
jgi:RHS repeat-associated protein